MEENKKNDDEYIEELFKLYLKNNYDIEIDKKLKNELPPIESILRDR